MSRDNLPMYIMDKSLVSLSAKAILKSLPNECIHQLMKEISAMYQLSCIHEVWGGSGIGYNIKHKGAIGLYVSKEEAHNAMKAHMEYLKTEYLKVEQINGKTTSFSVYDYHLSLNLDGYVQEYYDYTVKSLLDDPYKAV